MKEEMKTYPIIIVHAEDNTTSWKTMQATLHLAISGKIKDFEVNTEKNFITLEHDPATETISTQISGNKPYVIFHTKTAQDALVVLRILRDGHNITPDLLLTDNSMPDDRSDKEVESGIDLVAKVRSEFGKDMFIIANSSDPMEEAFTSAGADKFASKNPGENNILKTLKDAEVADRITTRYISSKPIIEKGPLETHAAQIAKQSSSMQLGT